MGGGWTRACRHAHPDVVEADKCAMKRSVNAIVRDAAGTAIISPAPYLHKRRVLHRIFDAANALLAGDRK